MRPGHIQAVLLSLLFSNPVVAHPYPHDDRKDAGFGFLMPRACAAYCGADNQYCCSSGETCTTSAGVASCAAGAGGGVDQYTTTWTETKTYTSTISSYIGPGPTTAASGGTNGEPCVPPEGSGQIACGPICCASDQYCAYKGQCLPNAASSGPWTQWTTVGVVTTQYSKPYRVTGGSTIVETSAPTTTGTAASETTTSTGAPAPVESTSGGLSGGAIAGIVIGTIAGVVLLLLLCFCCIARGLWGVVSGLFGGGRKKKETERIEVIEEHYSRRGSRHGSAYAGTAAGRPQHRTWFGGGGGRPASAAPRKEKSSGLGWLAAGLGGAAVLLGLRREEKREEKRKAASHRPPRTRSDYSSSGYYTDSYFASNPSSRSSDRRTRDTRRSRQTRGTRVSRNSRPSRV
ncbi:hypothetical protein GGR52DRAFT_549829 [Hypoxylon sp. FL1284]|nr:hypothetical protein GGR52DRAFT_549829 [Hypoxylon sp. FL1284]